MLINPVERKNIFTMNEPSQCHLKAAVDSFSHTATEGQMVDIMRTYALQIVFMLFYRRRARCTIGYDLLE